MTAEHDRKIAVGSQVVQKDGGVDVSLQVVLVLLR